ncbi:MULTISPECIES: hypothetical protein [Saccharothrix]|nr:hypothetical protein [Saccharothrix sp. CB00851]
MILAVNHPDQLNVSANIFSTALTSSNPDSTRDAIAVSDNELSAI